MLFSRFSKTKTRKTCAIAQMEGVHEEIIPSLVHALNACGYKPEIFVNEKCVQLRGDVFAHVSDLDCVVNYVPVASRPDWNNLANRIKRGGHEFLVMSTFQRDGVAAWAEGIGLPIIGVVHNVELFRNAEVCRNVFSGGRVHVLCLAPHVASYLQQRVPIGQVDDIGIVESLYWGHQSTSHQKPKELDQVRRIAVPGGVSFKSRAFKELVSALVNDKTPAGPRLVFQILGGGESRSDLEALVREQGLEDSFDFAPLGPGNRVLYEDYIEKLDAADILHPLAPMSFAPYREHKITSAVPTAAGFGLPIILDRWTANVYRAPAIVCDSDLPNSLKACRETSASELQNARAEMAAYRERTLTSNSAEMERLLSRALS